MIIVDEIRKNKESGMSLENAIAKAVKECAARDILRDFLEKYGGEIINMLYAEWDWDEYIAVQRREAAEDARDEERKVSIKIVEQARDEERKAAIKVVEQARNEERKAAIRIVEQARDEERKATAKKALEMGLSPEQAAKLSDLSVDEVTALVENH